jgi:hypothetical protein
MPHVDGHRFQETLRLHSVRNCTNDQAEQLLGSVLRAGAQVVESRATTE